MLRARADQPTPAADVASGVTKQAFPSFAPPDFVQIPAPFWLSMPVALLFSLTAVSGYDRPSRVVISRNGHLWEASLRSEFEIIGSKPGWVMSRAAPAGMDARGCGQLSRV